MKTKLCTPPAMMKVKGVLGGEQIRVGYTADTTAHTTAIIL
ncbi:MAG: hypothetical protein NT028_10605 [candidate division Zixibacteria bacterium]|nr:hypothetical protein [candidate division Zixibacteria bacterium]